MIFYNNAHEYDIDDKESIINIIDPIENVLSKMLDQKAVV
jgi:hypothetical protein